MLLNTVIQFTSLEQANDNKSIYRYWCRLDKCFVFAVYIIYTFDYMYRQLIGYNKPLDLW